MSGQDVVVRYRDATERDADFVAALHAESWRRHYRGAYLDSYLDGDVITDANRYGEADWRDLRRASSRCLPIRAMRLSASPIPFWTMTHNGDHFSRTSMSRVS